MLKRKKSDGGDETPLFQATASVPDEPALPEAPPEAGREPRTTCYPQDGEAPPAVLGRERTTVYRQAVKWNRGGYDTLN